MKKYLKKFWTVSSTQKDSSKKQLEITLTKEQVFICELSLPVMPAKEIKEAVEWELPFHIPLTKGSYYYDYELVSNNEGMQQVLAVAVAKEVVAKLDQEAKEEGLLLVAVKVEGFEELNLFTEGKARLRMPRSKQYYWGAVGALGLAAILCVGSWSYKIIQVQKLNAVQKKIEVMLFWEKRFSEQELRFKATERLRTALAKYEKERIVWSKLLPILGSCIPKECWLTQIKQKEEKDFIELQGKAVNIMQVQKLIDNLYATQKFKNIKLVETIEGKDELLRYKLLLQEKGEQ